MNKLAKPGQLIFAAGMTGLGILCILFGDFIIGRPPAWPEHFHLKPVIGYVGGGVIIIASVLIMLKKKAGEAALVIAFLILILSVFRHAPVFMNDWGNAYKALALVGGALIIATSFFRGDHNVRIKTRRNLVTVGSILLGIFLIVCGYAHFKFSEFVRDFIPPYIPFHSFLTYFTGVCLCAGGVGLLLPFTRGYAALLSGIMILGWFLLLHIPRFAANMNDASDRMGLFESFTFVGIFFVLSELSTSRS